MDTPEPLEIDQRLDELNKSYDDLNQRCLNRSATRVAQELARLARSHQRLIPYLHARFSLMNKAQDSLEPEQGREIAIELIALLESADRARLLQPDLPEVAYADTIAWMSACAYDNLAKHTGQLQGFNSEGMQGCIREGIQVCQRTGKLRCITCFREYATSVCQQGDDLDMALHYARLVQAMPVNAPNSERRWVGAKDETWLLLLQGQLPAAEVAARRALELAAAYHTPLAARLESEVDLRKLLLLMGREEAAASPNDSPPPRELPAGELPMQDLRWDQYDALRACCHGDFARAVELLTHWDRWLTEHQCLHEWFEVRLRLIAAQRLAGASGRVEALARQLESKARPAHDWLTLRRLQRLLDPGEVASPLALLAPLAVGPFAASAPVLSIFSPSSEAAPAEPSPAPSPLEEIIQQFGARLEQESTHYILRAILLNDILDLAPESVTSPFDAERLIHLCNLLLDRAHANAMWRWAEAVARPFPQHAVVVNLLATLGDLLRRISESPLEQLPSAEQVERLFRQSLDLDPNHAPNFARAGSFFLNSGQMDEAERCLARGFRLNRTHSFLALELAEIYRRTERPRDALAVLDMCLRDGNEDAEVAWQAILMAYPLGQYEALLTYLDRFEELAPDQPWTNYFRALGLLEVDQPENALAAVEEEARRNPKLTFAVSALRACATYALGQETRWPQEVEMMLRHRLAEVDYLTVQGLTDLAARVWQTCATLPKEHFLRSRMEDRWLAGGLAPEALFEDYRQQGEAVSGVRFYRCVVQQTLDEQWPTSDGCLNGQENWPEYRILWGVLARDEDEAERLVLSWQARCYSGPAVVEAVEGDEQTYTDRPGVVWQGLRWATTQEEEETPG